MASESTPSCFVPVKALPFFEDRPVGGLELCLAMERVCGEGKVDGAMKISGLWRLQVKDRTARNSILLHGLNVRGVSVTVLSKNPFLVDGQDTCKLIIGNIPFSVADSEIAKSLKSLNVILASDIKWEHYREENGRLTSFKTGRRFVYIAAPPSPLPHTMKVAGMFNAFLYYRERENTLTNNERANRQREEPQKNKTPNNSNPIDPQDCNETGTSTEGSECVQASQGKFVQTVLNFNSDRGRQAKGVREGAAGEGRGRSSSKRRRSSERVSSLEKRKCQVKEGEGGEGGSDGETEDASHFDWFTNSGSQGDED